MEESTAQEALRTYIDTFSLGDVNDPSKRTYTDPKTIVNLARNFAESLAQVYDELDPLIAT
jgi:hypothetical protein